MKLTQNQENILNILKEKYQDGAFAEEIAEELKDLSFASVRATLVSLGQKGLVSKVKEEHDGRMLTKYTPINK